MKICRLSALLAVVIVAATGCIFGENLGSGLDIVNETDSPLIVNQHTIPANGGRFRIDTSRCGDGGLSARTEDGNMVAELTEEWCPGQTWTINGQDEGTLTDD